MTKKPILIIPFLFMLFGCSIKPLSQAQTNNSEIKVDFLFEHEGIKMYRFSDNTGYYHYFTDKGETITTQTSSDGEYLIHREENIR